MCCLFGLLDINHTLSSKEKERVLSILGTVCEARGVDATGYSYVSNRNLVVKKKAAPAHEITFHIPEDAYVIMGHTRMTTQGSVARQRNNHPFVGKLRNTQFSLAHNGVLSNDKALQKTEQLPQTNIETDSYVAVQLIEKQNTLDFSSLRIMAEKIKGTFTFSVMDLKNQLYLIKGNNPLCVYFFPDRGMYLYASTKVILETALDIMGYLNLAHEEIRIEEGEIVKIDANGIITRDYFQLPVNTYEYMSIYEDFWENWEPVDETPVGYRKYLMDFGVYLGIPEKELDYLHSVGLSDLELEECIYNKRFRKMILLETGYYYDEMEDYSDVYDDCFASLPWSTA